MQNNRQLATIIGGNKADGEMLSLRSMLSNTACRSWQKFHDLNQELVFNAYHLTLWASMPQEEDCVLQPCSQSSAEAKFQ